MSPREMIGITMATYAGALVTVAVAGIVLLNGYGLFFVSLPALVLAGAALVTRAALARSLPGASLLFVGELLGCGGAFAWADKRYAADPTPRPDLLRDIGSAMHNHLFPRAGLAVALIHGALAVAVIVALLRRP